LELKTFIRVQEAAIRVQEEFVQLSTGTIYSVIHENVYNKWTASFRTSILFFPHPVNPKILKILF